MKSVRLPRIVLTVAAMSLTLIQVASAQRIRTDDPVIRQMWTLGMEESQTEDLAQVLTDFIGPRLAGSHELDAAADWAVDKFGEWGVNARKEQYGTWNGWEFGITHVDLVAPRVSTLESEVLAWSPGTDGPIEGDVVTVPEFSSEAEAVAWLPSVQGKIVLFVYFRHFSPPTPYSAATRRPVRAIATFFASPWASGSERPDSIRT